ncbi:hypothetical protein EJ08DRAFT_39273 [Tothia fuscella]|uniref:Uncharacterized protein n=1 Tax=Tothia fuscella TaxID=1048955 RepID=A0A9P4NWR1_9PEZI|nr:hypothetical protein EJ08DRAFT_39273 [Tothia fuscella]
MSTLLIPNLRSPVLPQELQPLLALSLHFLGARLSEHSTRLCRNPILWQSGHQQGPFPPLKHLHLAIFLLRRPEVHYRVLLVVCQAHSALDLSLLALYLPAFRPQYLVRSAPYLVQLARRAVASPRIQLHLEHPVQKVPAHQLLLRHQGMWARVILLSVSFPSGYQS